MDSLEVLKARRIFVQRTYDEICAETDGKSFYNHTYYTLSKLCLNRTAQEEGLFTLQEGWFNLDH